MPCLAPFLHHHPSSLPPPSLLPLNAPTRPQTFVSEACHMGQLCADVVERALAPCKKVMADSKLTFDQIDVIEVVGASPVCSSSYTSCSSTSCFSVSSSSPSISQAGWRLCGGQAWCVPLVRSGRWVGAGVVRCSNRDSDGRASRDGEGEPAVAAAEQDG